MTAEIRQLDIAAYTIPTEQCESDGSLKWNSTTLVVVQVRADRETGIGYTYSHAVTGRLIDEMLRGEIVGSDPMAIAATWGKMRDATRNLGRPGIVSSAMAAVDLALWDLKSRLLGVSLLDLFGPVRNAIPIYASGGFTSYSIEQLCEQLSGWVEQGISRVKMKVGREPQHDLQRVKAARAAIGPQTELFVDANGAYSRSQALAMAEQLAECGVVWFEEPVSSDDLEGMRLIRDRAPAGMAITSGEYGYRLFYFHRMMQAEAVDVLMADATRCAGYTGFFGVGSLCQARSLPLSGHTAPNVHCHVCCASPPVCHLEYFHDHVRIEQMFFDGVRTPVDGTLIPDRSRPGTGLVIKDRDVESYLVWKTN